MKSIPNTVFPLAIDSDYTLFKVFNSSQSSLSANVGENDDVIPILAQSPNAPEIWSDNGFVTIKNELIYYDSVGKNQDGKVIELKDCIRGVEGDPEAYRVGTPVSANIVAQTHNQLVDAVMAIEDAIGDIGDMLKAGPQLMSQQMTRKNFLPPMPQSQSMADPQFTSSLNQSLSTMLTCSNPANDNCPDVEFDFNMVGSTAEYCIRIFGPYNTFQIDFGDGITDVQNLAGTHTYKTSGPFNPTVTVQSDNCCIVTCPTSPTEFCSSGSTPLSPSVPFVINIPEFPLIPTFVAPKQICPGPLLNFPPIILPDNQCSNQLSNISLTVSITPISGTCPSVISVFSPCNPSITVSFVGLSLTSVISLVGCCVPSTISFGCISFCNIPSFSNISFGPPPSFSPISFAQPPSFACVSFCNPSMCVSVTITPVLSTSCISFCQPPSFNCISFCPPPSFTAISFAPPPSFACVSFCPPSFACVSFCPPSFSCVSFCPPPSFNTISFAPPPSFACISFCPPSFSCVSFCPPPSFSLVSFAPPPSFTCVSFCPPPSFNTISFAQPPSFTCVSFCPPTSFTCVSFCPPPSFACVSFCPPPSFNTISFAQPPSFTTVSFSPPPSFACVSFCPPSFSLVSFAAPPSFNTISFASTPSFACISFCNPPSFACISFCNPPSFAPISFGNPPVISVSWGVPPVVSCIVQVQCPSTTSTTTTNTAPAPAGFAPFAMAPALEMDTVPITMGNIGIPEEIRLIVPKIPEQIKLVGLNQPIPNEITIKGDIPRSIQLNEHLVIDGRDIPRKILVEPAPNFPSSLKLEVVGMPQTLQVTGIPQTIEIVENIPRTIQLLMPDNPVVEMRWNGVPVELKPSPELEKLLSNVMIAPR